MLIRDLIIFISRLLQQVHKHKPATWKDCWRPIKLSLLEPAAAIPRPGRPFKEQVCVLGEGLTHVAAGREGLDALFLHFLHDFQDVASE